jgi:hypothetical protein
VPRHRPPAGSVRAGCLRRPHRRSGIPASASTRRESSWLCCVRPRKIRAGWTGEALCPDSSLVVSPVCVRGVPLPSRGDRGGGALVLALWPLVEELLAERGIDVDHVTVYRWVQRFTPLLADAARFSRHAPGGHYELGVDTRPAFRVAVAFTELARAI